MKIAVVGKAHVRVEGESLVNGFEVIAKETAAYLISLGVQAILAKLDLHAGYESIDHLQVLRDAAKETVG